ncbi:cell division topological specificity factor [Buchnera aphidicola (Cinara tujafilina)]|uniref:Cell division topological specificity factor n=1 Tax=Buchnera aphidicola (Cinara tujafilina) TaxID=261317 RepID=F7WZD4_9GAMM|nr:cell division topological specificity factor MinE [Buchnera aphidicola]AEH39796.1 cell division topological specificity factor [Buchnera aphidicola (Cinara tujafilina)]
MALLDFFLLRKKNTANIAKERLQIIIAKQNKNFNEPNYFPQLKNELLIVISKYIKITPEMITIQLEQKGINISILELNIKIPE